MLGGAYRDDPRPHNNIHQPNNTKQNVMDTITRIHPLAW